jgi:PhnB protein
MQTSPHVTFKDNCREAFSFYADTFGGKVAFSMTYGESPLADKVPPELRDKVIHARLDFGGQYLLGCDVPHERYQPPQGFDVAIGVEKAADAERLFSALARGGTVTMPMQETFWSQRFGMCTDRFGVPWMINCEKPS